jgi:hypothetical protein
MVISDQDSYRNDGRNSPEVMCDAFFPPMADVPVSLVHLNSELLKKTASIDEADRTKRTIQLIARENDGAILDPQLMARLSESSAAPRLADADLLAASRVDVTTRNTMTEHRNTKRNPCSWS